MKSLKISSIGIIILTIFIVGSLSSCMNNNEKQQAVVEVILKKENGNYQLYADGKPFYIKGAGLEYGNMESLAKHGGNSFRTWRVDNGTTSGLEVLDEAEKHGLMVCMGIEVGRERHGFDYDDDEAVKKQLKQIKQDVLALKDHPALLMWGIGNELNLHSTNPKVWNAVNEIATMIHEVDPNHPTTTMLAGAGKNEIELILERCPEIDLISFQLYGQIENLPKFIEESGYEGAYIVSEWGATGHWEVPKTDWGRPIEQNSRVKAKAYYDRYTNVILSDPEQCIGSFVFLWGQKQERTPTWYGVFLENGNKTEAVDMMEYAWTGDWPDNRAPSLKSMTIEGLSAYDNVYLEKGKTYTASAKVKDPENGKLSYTWIIMKEVSAEDQSDGGDFEPTPETVMEMSGVEITNEIVFESPEDGEYRLFVYATDAHGGSATANIPIIVK